MTDTRSTERRETAARSVALLLGVLCISAVLVGLTAAQDSPETETIGGYNISDATYTGNSLPLTNENPQGLTVTPDGEKAFEIGFNTGGDFNDGTYIRSYNLSDPYNLSSGSLIQSQQISGTGIDAGHSIAWNDDGTEFIQGRNDGTVHLYTVGSPYDISTVNGQGQVINAGAQIASGLHYNGTGDRLYVSQNDGSIVQYDLSTPYDPTTATQVREESFNTQSLHGAVLSDDGTYLHWADSNNANVEQYRLSDPWNISSATSDDTLNVQGGSTRDVSWGQGGKWMYETSEGGQAYQYNVTTAEIVLVGDLKLELNSYQRPGESQPYKVTYTVNGSTDDVTDNATVSSSDNATLTVYPGNNTLVAADDVSPTEVTITAEYETDQDSQNVTVAEPSITNLDHLPVWWKVNATVGDGMMLWLIVASLLAVVGTRAASPFAGIGCYVLTLAAGWIAGPVSDGVMVAAILAGLFLGLNVAANVDTSIRS